MENVKIFFFGIAAFELIIFFLLGLTSFALWDITPLAGMFQWSAQRAIIVLGVFLWTVLSIPAMLSGDKHD